jgi:N utilization substance protein A
MLDLKTMRTALEALGEERKISKEKVIDAIEQAFAAAYKKDYGKKGQIVRAQMDVETGKLDFYQVKIVVDETVVRIVNQETEDEDYDENDARVRYNDEHHIFLADAQMIKSGAQLEDEVIFPLEEHTDFSRIAAQTAKQVIMQKIREAEQEVILAEFGAKEGDIVTGTVDKIERGMVSIAIGRAFAIMTPEEQIPGEYHRRGERIKAYLYKVEQGPRGISIRVSRTHPKLIESLFAMECPEIANGTVEIRAIAREAGQRTKIAVVSHDTSIDPVGACVGQKGVRVTAVMSELHGEKIDIIPWDEDPAIFVANSLAPARVFDILIDDETHTAEVDVPEDQLSLAIGRGGQNVRLGAKLTGWKIDIRGNEAQYTSTEEIMEETFEDLSEDAQNIEPSNEELNALEVENEVSPVVDEENLSAEEIVDDLKVNASVNEEE